MKSRSQDKISVLMKICLLFIFLYLWILNCFFSCDVTKTFLLPNFIILAIAFLLVIGVKVMLRSSKPLFKKSLNENVWLALASAVLLFLQLILAYYVAFRTAWDPGAVWYGSHYVSMGDAAGIESMSEYFSIYPNNLLLVFVYSTLLSINEATGAHISNGGLVLVFFQCALLTMTGVFVFRCARRFVSVRASKLVYLLYAVLVGLSGWLVIPYSDGSGAVFPVLLLFLYLKEKESGRFINKVLYAGAIAFVAHIGYQIKPTALIAVIAMGILEGIAFAGCIWKREWETVRRGMICLAVMLAAWIISAVLVSVLIGRMGFQINEESALSWQHHAMIGLNVDSAGGFSQSDLEFSTGFSDKQERHRAELGKAGERLKEMGVTGYFELFNRKAVKNYLNGTFGWGGGESFYTEKYPMRAGFVCPLLRSLYYDDAEGVLYEYHAFFRQCIWLFVLAAVPFAALYKEEYSAEEKVLILSVLGLMLYLQIFESHARYLYIYVPYFIILAAMGCEYQGSKKNRRSGRG